MTESTPHQPMLEIRVLSGSRRDERIAIAGFPFRFGRARGNTLILGDPGVWDLHGEIHRGESGAIHAKSVGEAAMTVDGQPTRAASLRNGSVIDCGAVRLRLDLLPPRQRSLGGITLLFWALVVGMALTQVALLIRFLRP